MGAVDVAIARDRQLIGRQGGRLDLATPALILDLAAVEANMDAMAAHAARAGVALRPHTKTHKSVRLAKAQIDRGAIGICAARLGEAEAMAQGGIADILVTAPIVTPQAIARALDLRQACPGLKLVVDDARAARHLARACADQGQVMDVLLDIDIGLHRTGIAPDHRALELARVIGDLGPLNLVGLQAYGGHLMHIPSCAARRERSLAALKPVGALVQTLRDQGFNLSIISGGGSGT